MSETKMARASLKKTIAYATELLTMVKPDTDLEGWIQAKIVELDHNIEAVYSYYKFGDEENKDSEESDIEDYEDSEEEGRMIFVMAEGMPNP
jgi:hypothetical protein